MEKPSTVSAGNEQVLSKKLLPPATQFHHLFPFLFFLCGGTAGVGFLRLWPPIGHFSSFEKLMTGPSPCALWTLTAGARLFEGRRMQFSLLRSSDLRAVKFHALTQNEWHLTRWFGFRCRKNINQIVIDPEKKAAALWRPSGNLSSAFIWIFHLNISSIGTSPRHWWRQHDTLLTQPSVTLTNFFFFKVKCATRLARILRVTLNFEKEILSSYRQSFESSSCVTRCAWTPAPRLSRFGPLVGFSGC